MANDPVALGNILQSRCCCSCYGCVIAAIVFLAAAPFTAASLAWRLFPSFEEAVVLPGLVNMMTGFPYWAGDDWALECMKQRCPAESLFCLFDSDCRRYVSALYVGVDGTGSGLCSRDLAREAACGTTCSRATLAFSRCLEGPAGKLCAFSTDALPAVINRNALDEDSLRVIEDLARAEEHNPDNVYHRTFGSDPDGNATTGHIVTYLTPLIHDQVDLVRRMKEIARASAAKAEWLVREFESLNIRSAEVLDYGGDANSSGLGWHWDVGSTITMLTMLHPSEDGSGELQVSTNCTVQRLPLRRGDVAVYRSRQRHRVTTVTSPRRVFALEWWRGERNDMRTRPSAPAVELQEPLYSMDHALQSGNEDVQEAEAQSTQHDKEL